MNFKCARNCVISSRCISFLFTLFQAYRNVQYVPPVITTNVCQDVNNNNNNNISNNIISHSNNLTKSKRAVKTSLLYPHNTTTNCTIIPEESQINASPGKYSNQLVVLIIGCAIELRITHCEEIHSE